MSVRGLILFLLFPIASYPQSRDSIALNDILQQQNMQVPKGSFIKRSLIYIPPAAFIGYGIASLNNKVLQHIDYIVYADMQEDYPGFSTKADNYLQYTPAVMTGLLSLSGVEGKSSFSDQTALYAVSSGIVSVAVTLFKRYTNRLRPNRSSFTSFPSGHTSVAFAAAEFLNQEYGDRSPWYGIAGYTAATATGILRVYNNAHWFSDVIAGAGFGILSTKAAYFVYPRLKTIFNPKKQTNYLLIPEYRPGYTGIRLQVNPQ